MKRVCLDTDLLVALLRKKTDAVVKAEELDSVGADICTTSTNAFEIYLGAFRSREAVRNAGQCDEVLGSIKVLDMTLESSRKSGEILSQLIGAGQPIDLRDAIIAAVALVNDCVLLTRNVEHFKRVVGLSTEAW